MDDDRKREASLVTSAMSGLAIMGTWYQGSWGRSGWDKGVE